MPHLGRGDNMWLNMRGYIPFQVMAREFPLKGETTRTPFRSSNISRM